MATILSGTPKELRLFRMAIRIGHIWGFPMSCLSVLFSAIKDDPISVRINTHS